MHSFVNGLSFFVALILLLGRFLYLINRFAFQLHSLIRDVSSLVAIILYLVQ